MKHQLIALLFTAAVAAVGCHTQKSLAQQAPLNEYTVGAQKLIVKMRINTQSLNRNYVPVTFTVTNPTNKPLKFCKWESPFEPRLGKYFDVKDAQGNEAPFKGAMARRVMPPPASAFIEVPARKRLIIVVNLADNYTLGTNPYTVTYTGGGISGLASGNTVAFQVKR